MNRVNDPYVNIGGAGCRWCDGEAGDCQRCAILVLVPVVVVACPSATCPPARNPHGGCLGRPEPSCPGHLGATQVYQAGVSSAGINNIATATGLQNTRAERGHVGAAGGAGGSRATS
ncbi:hypothetical protein MRX96_029710 [Rhipicephalus microplus]